MSEISIGGKKVGEGHPTFIIAEMAWSHDGSKENARRIIEGAADAGSDAICFHLTSMEDYMVPHYRTGKGRVSAGKESLPIYEYLSSINLSPEDWRELFSFAKDMGLAICTMCNDFPSLQLARELGSDSYVISPASLAEEEMVRETARTKKPILLRIGGATLGEVERAISWVRAEDNPNVALIYGFQSYPTKLEDTHLRFIPTLRKMFRIPIGFADHTDGASEMAFIVPLLAVALGATILEKHITHNRELRGEDFESALDPAGFRKFVQQVREIEKSLGSGFARPLSDSELEYRLIARKRAVASRDIKKGEIMTRNLIAFKRSDEGVFPDEIGFILGRKAVADIKKNEGITVDKVE